MTWTRWPHGSTFDNASEHKILDFLYGDKGRLAVESEDAIGIAVAKLYEGGLDALVDAVKATNLGSSQKKWDIPAFDFSGDHEDR